MKAQQRFVDSRSSRAPPSSELSRFLLNTPACPWLPSYCMAGLLFNGAFSRLPSWAAAMAENVWKSERDRR